MFLDTACFFTGEHNSLAIEAWNGLGWSPLQSWQRLLDNHFVELDNDNYIKMHDHIRQMGRDIADRQSSYRLWFPQQIINIQKQEAKRIRIQGIMATSKHIKWINEGEGKEPLPALVEKIGEVDEFCIRCSQGELMVNTNGGIQSLAPSLVELNYFVVCGDSFDKVIVEVSRELVWLRWFQIGQRNLPSGLSLKNLRVLELYEGRNLEELWGKTDGEAPVQLRQLLISGCHKFQGFPKSIEHLNHLKKIEIFEGYNVTSLPDEFCHLQHLEYLVLHECKILLLPGNFGNLSNLRHVAFVFCNQLRRLPVCFKNVMLLEHLNLQGCSQLKFTSEDLNFLENIRELQFLNLSGCKQLQELPRHITNQAFLRELYFSGPSLRGVPDNIGELSRLKRMRIEDVMLTNLPTSLGDLFSLTNLDIRNCPKLDRLPDSLGDLSSLTNLDIRDCPKLKCLPDSIGDLSSLTNLSIKNCPKLELRNSFVFNDKSAWRFVNLSIENCPAGNSNKIS
ncbi:disease resistance protein RPV1-like [Cryptomeria japonica]|uniref:disease resistance protein RPV1-like n=1 Tax=Cryptomeria japonica TaxID=3369 RepID=UPI0027DA7913|nr:disease resistance protein RPV1-like [Cryptomeria japonica]XP_059065106.1 disease resistance protein RPV1-like [Cryptomeria japonica]XP_059065107.1 disease resistance protein RPV1-like [Cryptomeria japonica]XP_059065108.1 disease resistance protein RPV1-like [Cryptomeria japonica]